jgi:hypothetical protein
MAKRKNPASPESAIDKAGDMAADAPSGAGEIKAAPESPAQEIKPPGTEPSTDKTPETRLLAAGNGDEPHVRQPATPAAGIDATDDNVIVIAAEPFEPAGPALTPVERARRNPLLNWLSHQAALIALAACVGAVIGSMASNAIGYAIAVASADRHAVDPTEALRASVSQLATELASLKATVRASGQTSTAALANVLNRLDNAEKNRDAPASRIANLGNTPKPETRVSPEITGSINAATPPVAPGWVLWRVENGRALVQGNGSYYEVAPGSALPGLGMVQRIVHQDGRWVVQTPTGIIVPRG